MLWQELLVDQSLDHEELVDALARLFSVSESQVVVIEDITVDEVKKDALIVIERRPVCGDFRMKLSIYVRDRSLESIDWRAVVTSFCCRFNCSCITPDDSVNPYSMILITCSNAGQQVFLVPERLDERDEYTLVKTDPR